MRPGFPGKRRTPGVVGAVSDSPHVNAEIICDGIVGQGDLYLFFHLMNKFQCVTAAFWCNANELD